MDWVDFVLSLSLPALAIWLLSLVVFNLRLLFSNSKKGTYHEKINL